MSDDPRDTWLRRLLAQAADADVVDVPVQDGEAEWDSGAGVHRLRVTPFSWPFADDDAEWVTRVVLETTFVEDVPQSREVVASLLQQLNKELTLLRLVHDGRAIVARSVTACASSSQRDDLRTAMFALGLHASTLARLAEPLAEATGGRPTSQGQSPKLDLLRFLQEAAAPPAASVEDLDGIGRQVARVAGGTAETTGHRLHVELGEGTPRATLDVWLDETHPSVGPGVAVVLRLPSAGSHDANARVAGALNNLEPTDHGHASILGAWTAARDGGVIEHVTFVPGSLLDDPDNAGRLLTQRAFDEALRRRTIDRLLASSPGSGPVSSLHGTGGRLPS